uniref:Hum s 3 allergen n=1 Tax=Humulus scandens TaxID=228586 RepID=A0A6J3WU61_HUMSC|nr:Hum s 3 allergen [Humulus scandens]
MIAEVIKHLNVTENLKHTLNTSADFGVCVANHLCNCMALPYPPVIYACLGGLGFKCMKDALHLTPHLLACALACPNSPIVDTNSTTIIGTNNTTTITGSGSNTTAIIGTNNTAIINTNSTAIDSNSTLKHDHEALKDFCNNNCKKKD